MKRFTLIFTLILLLGWITQTQALTILQTAMLGPTGQGGGVSLSTNQFLGARFSITTPMQVQTIGGHIGSRIGSFGSLFGAIVSLSSPTALPSGIPFNLTTLAANNFYCSVRICRCQCSPVCVAAPPVTMV